METKETEAKRRKYLGVGGDDTPSLGVLEGDILRLLWDAGEPQSSVQMYDLMREHRKAKSEEMQSPSTIAVTLSRMTEKGLLTVERRPKGGKGYYNPTMTRAEVTAGVLDDTSRRLTGLPIGRLLSRVAGEGGPDAAEGAGMEELVKTLRGLK